LPSFGRAEYGGVKLPAWWEAPPKIGGCTPNRAGGAGTLGVRGIFSPVHARGKDDSILFRRLRPAELCEACPAGRVGWVERLVRPFGFLRAAARTCWVCPAGRVGGVERLVGPFGSFCGLPPGPAGFALPGESVGWKG